MESFRQYLEERFVNLIGDIDKKEMYKDQVWDIIQKSYAPIGGLKGSGFSSPDDMVKNIPFWKVIAKDGKVHGVVMYKDKGGRKSVAMGSDGSDYAKRHLADTVKNDIFRAYGEKSKAALGLLLKLVPWNILQDYTVKPTRVANISKEEIKIVSELSKDEIPADGQATLKKYPFLEEYAYLREIGGTWVFKVMFGSPGKKIEVN